MEKEAGVTVRMDLYLDVSNASEVLKMVMKGKLNCAIVDATMVADVFHVQQAAFRACAAETANAMATRSRNTEFIYCLSGMRSIRDALTTFGLSDSTTQLIAVFLKGDEADRAAVANVVKGVAHPDWDKTDLPSITNEPRLREVYGIQDVEIKTHGLVNAITNRIAAANI